MSKAKGYPHKQSFNIKTPRRTRRNTRGTSAVRRMSSVRRRSTDGYVRTQFSNAHTLLREDCKGEAMPSC